MHIRNAGALVVGGASGLGEATVRQLHEGGAAVTIADVNEDRGKALASELGIEFVACDVREEDQVDAAVTKAATADELSSPRQTTQVSSVSVGSLSATATIPSGSPPATVSGATAAAGTSARTPRSHPVWNDSLRTLGSKPARRYIAMNASCNRGAISRGNTMNSSAASAESGIASSRASG